jgi:hypothetical protein
MPYLFWMVLPLALMDAFAFPRAASENKRDETQNEEKQTA